MIGSKVVYVEDKFFGQVLFAPPNNPPNSSIYEAILVATNINALYQWKAEVPLQFRIKEWCNESTTSCINMNWGIPSAGKKKKKEQSILIRKTLKISKF